MRETIAKLLEKKPFLFGVAQKISRLLRTVTMPLSKIQLWLMQLIKLPYFGQLYNSSQLWPQRSSFMRKLVKQEIQASKQYSFQVQNS